MPVDIVISHASQDSAAAVALERHLTPMARNGKISIWHRGKAHVGDDADQECLQRMVSAPIIVLLVSPDLEVDRFTDIEEALRQRELRSARVIPVLVRPVNINDVRYGSLKMIPDEKNAISDRRDKDQAWVDVVQGIRRVVDLIPPSAQVTASAQAPGPPAAPATNRAPAPAAPPPGASPSNIKILFLAANPAETERLSLDREVHEIDDRILKSRQRDHFTLDQAWAVTAAELSQTLLRYRPTIVHFSGHGSPAGEIILLDAAGRRAPVRGEALAGLFRIVAKLGVRCVVLNACYSMTQADDIARYVDCVIGISGKIPDQTANAFVAGFYTGLAEGLDMHTAHDLGCVQIEMMGLQGADRPKLVTRSGIEPTTWKLF